MRLCAIFLVVLFIFNTKVIAFNDLVHEEMIKSAFDYINTTDTVNPIFKRWLKSRRARVEAILARMIVDVDYQADLWIGAWYTGPFAGGKTNAFGMLTSLYHFVNVTKPGIYWRHDGYAFRNTDGTGNDSFLGMSGMKIRGDLSFPLKGKTFKKNNQAIMNYLGDYKLGFNGTESDWQKLYFNNADMSKAVLPPSYVPAEKAYKLFINSRLADEDKIREWKAKLTVIENYVFKRKINHHFRSEEIKDYPVDLEKLGIALHMMQDLAMPHHAQGYTGYCHTELEEMVDVLACRTKYISGLQAYKSGSFDHSSIRQCQKLYDASMVTRFLNSANAFANNDQIVISDLLINFALESAKWRFGKLDQNDIGTQLPDGKILSGKNCKLLENEVIYRRIEYQYNYAVAGTIFILENAFINWEKNHKLTISPS